ncbi:MAG: ABC transporter substrate-binding protein [Lachnospiraceae bacterium]|nr:ABC transporter substrate-binding protein [Lachnospiraceae bacterium]
MKKGLLKQILGTVLVGVLAIGVTACGSDNTTSNAVNAESEKGTDNSELKPLRIGIGGSDGGGILEGAALAVENGYFEEELAEVGYYPEYVYFTGAGPEINEAFAGGNIDAAIVGDFPTFTAKSNGIDNTIIALTNQKVNYGILTTEKDATSISDLKGKTAVVYGGSITQFFWQNYLVAENIQEDEIPSVNSTDATTLLTSGDAQIYPVTSYMAYFLESTGLGHVIDTSDANIWTTFVFEINTDLVQSNPDVGVAVNKALIRSARAAQENPQSQYDALASENISAEAWEKYYSADPTLSNLSPEITNEVLEFYETENKWMLDNGVIANSVDVSSFVDTSYYEKALKELAE